MQLVCQYGNLVDEGSYWCRNCTRGCPPNRLSYVLDPTEQFDDLTIVERIAVFPASALYHATRDGQPVLLKIAHRDQQDDLKREMQLLWQIERHPAFLHPISASTSEERPYGKFALRGEMKYYGVFEDVKGTLLREILNSNPQPATRYVGWITLGLVDAVMLLHIRSRKAVGNLTPDNLLVRHDREGVPRPILLDLSHLTSLQEPTHAVMRGAGNIARDLLAANKIDSSTDIQCLGLLMYEMLAGQPAVDTRQPVYEPAGPIAPHRTLRSLALSRPDLSQALISATESAMQPPTPAQTMSIQRLARELVKVFGELPAEKKRFHFELDALTIGLLGGLLLLLLTVAAILL